MPKRACSEILRGEQPTKATAELVFSWKKVHKHDDKLIGNKAGQGRTLESTAQVPDYANDPRQAAALEDRIKQLGRAIKAKLQQLLELQDNKPFGFS